jgi:hypothetical protein
LLLLLVLLVVSAAGGRLAVAAAEEAGGVGTASLRRDEEEGDEGGAMVLPTTGSFGYRTRMPCFGCCGRTTKDPSLMHPSVTRCYVMISYFAY